MSRPLCHVFAPDKGQSLSALIRQEIRRFQDRYGVLPVAVYVPGDAPVLLWDAVAIIPDGHLHRNQIGMPVPDPVFTIVQKELPL